MSRRGSAFASGGNSAALRRAQIVKAVCSLALRWIELVDAKASKQRLHAIDDPCALANQILALAHRPLCVFIFNRRRRRHAAMARFAAGPTQQDPQKKSGVEPNRFRAAAIPG
jgi:hypothetical protein